MPELLTQSHVLWYSGRAEDRDLARRLSQSVGLPVAVPDSETGLLRSLSEPRRPLALVLGGTAEDAGEPGLLVDVKRRARNLPIVFLGHEGRPELELAVRRLGVHYYASGPPTVEEVAAVIAALQGPRGALVPSSENEQ